jgi:hypothetical protein
MKKILTIVAVVALGAMASYSQGVVSIALSGGTLVTTNSGGSSPVSGKAYGSGTGAFYYELLIASPSIATTANNITSAANLALWSDSGVSGVSGATSLHSGWITSATSASATGWAAPGVNYDNEMAYIIVGWSASEGTSWSAVSALLSGSGLVNGGYFGTTAVSYNYAGGGTSLLPAVNLWINPSGTTGYGVQSGLVLNQVTVVPEPCTMALLGLGGLSLLVIRRRK